MQSSICDKKSLKPDILRTTILSGHEMTCQVAKNIKRDQRIRQIYFKANKKEQLSTSSVVWPLNWMDVQHLALPSVFQRLFKPHAFSSSFEYNQYILDVP